MPQGTQIEHDFEGKGSFDAEGKSFVLNTAYPPAEGLAQINMSTIATPKVPAAGMPGAAPVAKQGEEEEEEGAEEALKEHLAALFANLNLLYKNDHSYWLSVFLLSHCGRTEYHLD